MVSSVVLSADFSISSTRDQPLACSEIVEALEQLHKYPVGFDQLIGKFVEILEELPRAGHQASKEHALLPYVISPSS